MSWTSSLPNRVELQPFFEKFLAVSLESRLESSMSGQPE